MSRPRRRAHLTSPERHLYALAEHDVRISRTFRKGRYPPRNVDIACPFKGLQGLVIGSNFLLEPQINGTAERGEVGVRFKQQGAGRRLCEESFEIGLLLVLWV